MTKKGHAAWTLTKIGCPDCSGVLQERRDGKHGHREYRCFVGHRHSTRSLLQVKEEQFERLLWSAVAVIEHIETVCGNLKEEMQRVRRSRMPSVKARVREIGRQKRALRAFIQHTSLCDVGEL